MGIVDTKFGVEHTIKRRDGTTETRTIKYPIRMDYTDGRIEFLKSPFALKNDIKSMQGSRWHGYDTPKRQIWSVADSYRNHFQIEWLSGGNPYEWFDRPIEEHDYPQFGSSRFGYHDLMGQQVLMANTGLTYHYQIWGAEMGVGKTLSAIAVMHEAKVRGWWWVGPKSSLYGIKQEFERWGLDPSYVTEMMSYEAMVQKMKYWKAGEPAPIGVVFDESQRLKTPSAQRTQCAQQLADSIRSDHGMEGFCLLMTGTPSPKSPGDWWSQCEIAWPGFLKEGERKSFEQRMGFFRVQDNLSGQTFNTRVAWKDDEDRCAECGYYETGAKNAEGLIIREGGHHMLRTGEINEEDQGFDVHVYKKSVNEVALMTERLDGLVTIVHKADCLDLPDKLYRQIELEPQPAMLRVAKAIANTATNVIGGLTLLRELSDGFQYRQQEDGYEDCPTCEDGTVIEYYHPNDPDASISDPSMLDPEFVSELVEQKVNCRNCKGSQKIVKYKRITRRVACPKEDAVLDLLDLNEDQGRIVFFAGFTGSLDRIVEICQKANWNTMRVDGRGWRVEELVGKPKKNSQPETRRMRLENPLTYWQDPANGKVAFVAHPKSGGISLTLCPQGPIPGATTACFYSNDFDPASRSQAEDRIHRIAMDIVKGATIVDLLHLPTDYRVRDVLQQNRKLELMSMGRMTEDYDDV